jgi:hypothetical protein
MISGPELDQLVLESPCSYDSRPSHSISSGDEG